MNHPQGVIACHSFLTIKPQNETVFDRIVTDYKKCTPYKNAKRPWYYTGKSGTPALLAKDAFHLRKVLSFVILDMKDLVQSGLLKSKPNDNKGVQLRAF